MKLIPLTQQKYAKVTDEDFEYLSSFNWCMHSKGYAYRTGGKLMHRVIMGEPEYKEIDHINGDKLDNQRKNLRICSRSENSMNKAKYCGKGIYIGVHHTIRTGKYEAYIKFKGRKLHLGHFDTAEQAAIARNVKALELYGEFARLNTIL